ncbi:hypothetical protein AAE021_04100 [Arthrobacter citreus]|uniref:Meckel syndrome type 1 protein n=1 Tax=Arthrobacter citreus TaxID=1670 RepID=A0ABZ2ZX31_9MICC
MPQSVRRNHDLLGWGVFLALTSAAAMMWAGIDWKVTAVCGFLLLLSFSAVWYVSSTPPAAPAAPPAAPVDEAALAKETAAPKVAVAKPAKNHQSAMAAAEETTRAKAANAKEPVPVPAAAAPAASQAAAAEAPLTRKQMRAADPTTGVMPVVSVFARKPASGPATSPARSSSSPADPAVPAAPAGAVLQGIDTGAAVTDSRRARRAAAAAAAASTKKKNAGKAAAGAAPAAPASDAGPQSVPGPSTNAPADASPDEPGDVPADAPADATAAADAASAATAATGNAATDTAATAENSDGESRWTRVFGPPETGQLPVQRYVAAASAVDTSGTERQQRSHSSL